MDNIKALFFDHLGNFQWTSITSMVSLTVLAAQGFLFFYQQKMLKVNKKIETLIQFRIDSLKEVKQAVFMLMKIIEPGVKHRDMSLLNKSQNLININLNSKNDQSSNLSGKIINLLSVVRSSKDNNMKQDGSFHIPIEQWSIISHELTESYQMYEESEIEKISQYK